MPTANTRCYSRGSAPWHQRKAPGSGLRKHSQEEPDERKNGRLKPDRAAFSAARYGDGLGRWLVGCGCAERDGSGVASGGFTSRQPQDHQARNPPRQAALAVPEDAHQRGPDWARRTRPRRPRQDLRRSRCGDGALPHRARSAPRRAPLAGALSPLLLSRRTAADQRTERRRASDVGHHGPGHGRAGLSAPRGPHARPHSALQGRRQPRHDR